jgi:hypothetical protein
LPIVFCVGCESKPNQVEFIVPVHGSIYVAAANPYFAAA